MKDNPLRKRLESGPIFNGWVSSTAPMNAETMVSSGFDSITLDLQHGLIDYRGSLDVLPAIPASMPTLARVAWLDPAHIQKTLDTGVVGIICPMVADLAGAKSFIEMASYPPVGYRSFGPTRAMPMWGGDYAEHANSWVVKLIMLEMRGALDDLEAILDLPGIDGVYIGPADLSLALGDKPSFDRTDDRFMGILERVSKACGERGLFAGIHTKAPSYAHRMAAMGLNFITVANDLGLIRDGATAALKVAREGGSSDTVAKSTSSGY